MHLLFLLSFVDLQMHIVIIFVLITSVVVYFCSRLPADPKYLDALKTRVYSILCHYLNLITDYYFRSSSSSIIGTVPVQKTQTVGGARAMVCSPVPKVGGAAAPSAPPVPTPMGSNLWNQLPFELKLITSINFFKCKLKIYIEALP